jgi:hypothetical protein
MTYVSLGEKICEGRIDIPNVSPSEFELEQKRLALRNFPWLTEWASVRATVVLPVPSINGFGACDRRGPVIDLVENV